jgi:hypothetical protein
MREENERKKEERKVKQNLVSELLSENASSNLVSNFSHQIFLVKIVRLLGVIFQDLHQIGSPK